VSRPEVSCPRAAFGALFLASAALASMPALADPRFAFTVRTPGRVEMDPGDPRPVEIGCRLSSRGLDAGGAGVRAWSLSLAVEGCRITEAITQGTAAAGTAFAVAEVAADGRGVVSAAVLAFDGSTMLDPSRSHELLRVKLEGEVPQFGNDCIPWRAYFAEGREHRGVRARNEVATLEEVLVPELGEATVEVCPLSDCSRGRLNLIFQHARVDPAPHETLLLFAHLADEIEVPVRRGETGRARVWAAIISQIDEPPEGRRVTGWTLSARVYGDIVVTHVTTDGTAAASIPEGRNRAGYEYIEIVDPDIPDAATGKPQGPGFVGAVSLGRYGSLSRWGTASILEIDVVAARPLEEGPIEGEILWEDGMRGQGPHQIKNWVSLVGYGEGFCQRRGLRLRFVPPAPFLRCDVTADGVLGIADAVALLGSLYRGAPAPPCREAADCNGDGTYDVSDPVFLLWFLFLGGSPPPPPFPLCGGAACVPRATSCR
jgi:hypothetical protein